MSINRNLFRRFLSIYPHQPATAFWRTIEIAQLTAKPFPTGLGLDLGCGDGKLTKIILDRVGPRNLIGVDIDSQETQQATQHDFYNRIHTVSGSAIPENDGTFDFVLSNSVLEHIDNIHEVLCEIGRLLKPGAVFLFTVPSDGFHPSLRGPMLPWASRTQYLISLDSRLAHKRYWSEEEWRRELRHYKMEIEQVTLYLTSREVKRWETISRWTAGVLEGVFSLLGKRRPPIEIQRTLGIRNNIVKMPAFLIGLLASLLTLNLPENDETSETPYGCFMFLARKQ